MYGSVLSFN